VFCSRALLSDELCPPNRLSEHYLLLHRTKISLVAAPWRDFYKLVFHSLFKNLHCRTNEKAKKMQNGKANGKKKKENSLFNQQDQEM